MGLFSKSSSNNKNSGVLEDDKVILPTQKISSNEIILSLFDSILELGDEEDVKLLCKTLGKKLFEKNKSLFINNSIFKIDDMEILINILNLFLMTNRLGYIKFIFDKKQLSMKLIHYEFHFIDYVEDSVLILEEFYKLLFSEILEKSIKLNYKREEDEIIFEFIV